MRNSGKLVRTKTDQVGRTFDSKGLINGKVAVYLATVFKKQDDFEFPTEYSDKAILCEPSTLKVFGYLD
jgi:hypothetical protein